MMTKRSAFDRSLNMKHTRLQKAVLRLYWCYHTEGWRLGPYLRANALRWLLLLAIAAGAGWVAFHVAPWVAALYAGMCLGAFLRDVGRLLQSRRLWPLVEDITDWRRVEQLIETEAAISSTTGNTSKA